MITTDIHSQKILILDFGSQYTQLIARRVRELKVYCEIHHYDLSDKEIKSFAPTGIILSGGPNSVHADATPQTPQLVFELGCPVLGICYGMQTMAQQLGGKVERADKHEYGYAQIKLQHHCELLSGIEDDLSDSALLDVWMSHGDFVSQVPAQFTIAASTADAPIAAIADDVHKHYGVQFHPEVTHTKQGKRILERFVVDICGCKQLWTAKSIIAEKIEEVKKQVGKDHVLLGLSGGVDSSVVAALLHQAIGKQLTCVFVDNGLLRRDEKEQVENIFSKHMDLNVIYVDAGNRFLNELAGVADPEQKRKIIGKVFIEVFEEEAKKLEEVKYLAQGTIYPDVIESAAAKTGTAEVIKSHHNVGGLPERMKLDLVEPLRELFKDEVREVGIELGLPSEMVYRHPFPGPGLGVRILGEIKPEYIPILQHADDIFIEELRTANLYGQVSQALAVFLPIKTVGVKGDSRSYDYVISLRAVETTDFMTAHMSRLPFEFLEKVANRIMNEVEHVSRVVYDISSKPPATIEWE